MTSSNKYTPVQKELIREVEMLMGYKKIKCPVCKGGARVLRPKGANLPVCPTCGGFGALLKQKINGTLRKTYGMYEIVTYSTLANDIGNRSND